MLRYIPACRAMRVQRRVQWRKFRQAGRAWPVGRDIRGQRNAVGYEVREGNLVGYDGRHQIPGSARP
jgi:hypothetical protein